MSEKMAKTIRDAFVDLQRELADKDLKNIIDSAAQEISDDEEGLYEYEIPLKDGSGQLVFSYRDKDFYDDYGYFFIFIKHMPLHSGFVCSDFADSFDEDLPVYDFFYDDDEDEGWGIATITSWNEASWKTSSASKREKNREKVLEAWQFLKDLEKFSKKDAQKSQEKYDAINGFFKAALAKAAKKESDITGADSDGYFKSPFTDLYQLTLYFDPETKAHSPELYLWCDRDDVGAWTNSTRYGITQKKCENLAQAFLDEDEKINFGFADGRGEEGTFSFDFNINKEELDFNNPAPLSAVIVNLYKKTKEFATLIKNKPNLSINDIKPIPEEFKLFEDFVKELYSLLEGGAVDGLEVLPMLSEKMAWGADSSILEMYIPLKGDVFLLGISCSVYGYIEMSFYDYRFGSALRSARECWTAIGGKEDISLKKGKGRGETAWLMLQKYMGSLNEWVDGDIEARLKSLNPAACVMELGRFFVKAAKLAHKLKSLGYIGPDTAEEAIKKLQLELSGAQLPENAQAGSQKQGCETFLSISCQPNVVLNPEKSGEEGLGQGAERPLDEESPGPAEEEPSEDEESAVEEESQEAGPSQELMDAFRQFSNSLIELLKRNAALEKSLSAEISQPDVENGALIVRVNIDDSPVKLRIKYDPGENMLDAGFGAWVQEGQIASFRKYGRRLKEKLKSQFSMNEDSSVFIVYLEEKTVARKPMLEKPDAFAHKVAALYEPTLKMYRRVTG